MRQKNSAFLYMGIIVAFVFFTKIMFLINAPHTEQINGKKATVETGIEFFEKNFKNGEASFNVKYYEIDTSKVSLGITTPQVLEKKPKETNYSAYTLKEYSQKGGYKIVQSGGFLSSWSPPLPLGFVKAQGKEYNKTHDSWLTKGIFCTDGKKFKIDTYKDQKQFENWPSCMQTGPIIALDKKNILNTSRNTWFVTGDIHRQSFICKNSKGNLIMGIAESISLQDLVSTLTKSENEGGLNCDDAVLLTSKGIAGIYSESSEAPSIGSFDVPLPNAIIVK